MLTGLFSKWKFFLASSSPRRKELLTGLGIEFEVVTGEVPEDYTGKLNPEDFALLLARRKANQLKDQISDNQIVIAADTIVYYLGEMLGKPKDVAEATTMLKKLSGGEHVVITAVCLLSTQDIKTFYSKTLVSFVELEDWEIGHYIDQYGPFDKAGAYGIQEWIGMIGIDRIEGSYFNVMGLPVHELYLNLKEFIMNHKSYNQ